MLEPEELEDVEAQEAPVALVVEVVEVGDVEELVEQVGLGVLAAVEEMQLQLLRDLVSKQPQLREPEGLPLQRADLPDQQLLDDLSADRSPSRTILDLVLLSRCKRAVQRRRV